MDRHRARGHAAEGPRALRPSARRGRDGRGGPGSRRHRGVVPRSQRVRAPRPGPSLPAGAPGPAREPRAAQRRQGTRAVPSGGADGAGRACGGHLLPGPPALAVHAVRPRRRALVAGPDPRRGPRRRDRPHPDRLARGRTAPGPHAGVVREAYRSPGRGQHQSQHRRTAHGRQPERRVGVLRLVSHRPPRDGPLRRTRPGRREMTGHPSTTVVLPTVGRPSLETLLETLATCVSDAASAGDPTVLVVDDRPDRPRLRLPDLPLEVTVLRSWGGGPALARNVGWRHARTEWVSFL